jgi:hypothetical protein
MQKPRECDAPAERLPRQFFEAGGANDAVIVFGDALAAETAFTLRAARHGFTGGMIETTLMSQILHDATRFKFRK